MKPSGRSCALRPSRRGRGSAEYCNGEPQGGENAVAIRIRRKTMAGFPKYLFTPCVLAYIEALVDQTSIWKDFTDLSSADGFLFASVCLVLSDWQEWSDFAKALGKLEGRGFGIWSWLRRKREDFTKETNIHFIFLWHCEETLLECDFIMKLP